MNTSKLYRLLTALILVALLAACAAPATPQPAQPQPSEPTAVPAPELTKIQFRLNWTLYGEHAPFYLGMEKGFYKEEGLDVDIVEGSGSSTVIKLIGNGTNVIGYADAATMMRGVAAGVPVKAVAVIFQSSPMSFIYRQEAPKPTKIDELKGLKVAVTAGDASMAIFESCLGANGMTLKDVNMIQVSNPAAKETSVLEGTADTFLGYFVDQPLRMEKVTGVDMGWTKLVDICGVNTLSSAIIANNFWAEQNPEVLKKFVRASQRAWAYSAEHPQEAAEIFVKYASAFDVPLALEELEGSLTLHYTDFSKGKALGWSAAEDWTATQDVLVQYAGFKAEEDINAFYTNDFISEPPYMPAK